MVAKGASRLNKMGESGIVVIPITDENSKIIQELILRSYMSDVCEFCGRTFTLSQVRESVWWPWRMGRIAHKECWHRFTHGELCEELCEELYGEP